MNEEQMASQYYHEPLYTYLGEPIELQRDLIDQRRSRDEAHWLPGILRELERVKREKRLGVPY